MKRVIAIYGSPRRSGNTAVLLKEAVRGAMDAGAHVDELILRDLHMSPCLEIYGCLKTGRCVIQDDFQKVYDMLSACDGLMLASPIFFYSVSAHTKILMDRCQSLWVKKHWIEKDARAGQTPKRPGMFISVGATKGKRLFEGSLLSLRYFFDVLDVNLWKSLLYRGMDFEGDVAKHPEYLREAYEAGGAMVESMTDSLSTRRKGGMSKVDFHAIFTAKALAALFPASRTDQFFEALFGDAEEGAYTIELVFHEAGRNALHFEFHLKQRAGKCLACNLTYGLPEVFSRHPVININGLVKEIDQLLGGSGRCSDWRLGNTQEKSPRLHVVPLLIHLKN